MRGLIRKPSISAMLIRLLGELSLKIFAGAAGFADFDKPARSLSGSNWRRTAEAHQSL